MSSAAGVSNKYVTLQTAGQRVEQGQGSLRGRRVDHQQGDEGSFDFTNLRQQLARLEGESANTGQEETPSQPSIAHVEYEEVSAAAPSQPSTVYVEAPSSQGEVSAADDSYPQSRVSPLPSGCIKEQKKRALVCAWLQLLFREHVSGMISKIRNRGQEGEIYPRLARDTVLNLLLNISFIKHLGQREDRGASEQGRAIGKALAASLQDAGLDYSQFLEAFSRIIQDTDRVRDDAWIPYLQKNGVDYSTSTGLSSAVALLDKLSETPVETMRIFCQISKSGLLESTIKNGMNSYLAQNTLAKRG